MQKKIAKRAAAKAEPTTRGKVARKTADAERPPNPFATGLDALTSAQTEAIARQSRVFESLLGVAPKRDADGASASSTATPNPLAAALDPFGFRKFEDVFDQRVARALAHLGMPTAEAFAALEAEVAALRARVAALEGRGKR